MLKFDGTKIIECLKCPDAKIILTGDGFVDEVWEIVSSRTGLDSFTPYSEMNQFANRITNSGTGGVGVELVKKRRAFGGFTANLGYASARLGVDTTIIGVYGKDNIDPIFNPVESLCRVISLGEPSVTHVLEFNDGKIMMSYMEAVMNINWNLIVEKLGMDKICSFISESDIIGVGYWSLLPAFDDIVKKIYDNLPSDSKQRRFFFDFADFRKRDKTSLIETLSKLKVLNEKIPVMLSLNEHEAADIFDLFGEKLDDKNGPVEKKAENVRQQLGFDELIIHTPHLALAASQNDKAISIKQDYCEKPVRTVGAGDTFNGGYLAARLSGLCISDCLYVANSTVSFLLRNGYPPNKYELFNEMMGS